MVHLGSYKTCDNTVLMYFIFLPRGNGKDTAGDKRKLLAGRDNHFHFKTKTEISAIHMDQRKVSLSER